MADPYPAFAELRREEPVHWSEAIGSWVLTRYDDVSLALSDPRFSSDRITPYMERAGADPLGQSLRHWAVFNDPPRHTRLRSFLNRAFTPRAIQSLAPAIESVVEKLFDQVEGRDEFDFIGDFAYPLPATVIAGMLGVPSEDLDQFKAWSDELAGFVGGALATPDKRARAERGLFELNEYFRAIIADRRRHPREDLVGSLVAAREKGDALSEDELLATCVMILFAGHETTTNLLGNGILSLVRHPDQLRLLREEPALIPAAVEELLRFDGPVQAMGRTAGEEIELRGCALKRGDRVYAMINAANRDPEQFENPDLLDLRRRPNRHIAFGVGIHFCLGAPLARLEAQIAFDRLLSRFGAIELATDDPEWNDSLILRGLRRLPLRASRI